ncbi:hypothetical protein [Streptomyces capitiformicae]|uniref:Uncharacterized protein n=1 Tax=Streptomyces capitiformicae TaxID=2014920 RepID=A0A919GJR6_9ACTN|nr:hypothetical protein [Streptomyces capitiformicae]GHH85454.1 hypothetical protein GCM10017771_18380 [Streptomyces capitiformicae]
MVEFVFNSVFGSATSGNSGRVAESGTHDELLDHSGRYAAFWTERSRAQDWRLANQAAV